MTLDNMTGITEGSYTGFCKSQLITCNRVKECNGVCPFEDALKHADKTQTMNEQHTIDHDREWIIGCIEHDGFIHTHRFDKANQIILDALSADTVSREHHDMEVKELKHQIKDQADMVSVVRCKDCKHWHSNTEFCGIWSFQNIAQRTLSDDYCSRAERRKKCT